MVVAVAFEAAALGIRPLRDILGLTVLPPTAWAAALAVAVVPLVLTQTVRIARDRPEPVVSAAGTR
ncbi:hypothetical protein [Gordonia iterans]|uniref:hypothetical protein n=1 Tax=Gordonia iterans TaxID=1004901 RepID=UPI0038995E32